MQTLRVRRRCRSSPIDNEQAHTVTVTVDPHLDTVARSVLRHVGQPLPCDAVDGNTDRPGQLGRRLIDRHVDDEASTAVVVDERGDVSHPGQRRVGAPFVGSQGGDRGPDLVEARSADRFGVDQRPLGLGEVPAQHVPGTGDVEQHRRQRVPGQVVQLAGDAPPLLGHLLVGRARDGPAPAARSTVLAGTRPARG